MPHLEYVSVDNVGIVLKTSTQYVMSGSVNGTSIE